MQEPSSMSVLVIIANSTVFKVVQPFLERSDLDVSRTPDALDGLGLSRLEPSDLVVAQYPLRGLTEASFFDAFYQSGSASAGAPLLVVTRRNRGDEIQEYLQGRNARACYLESAHDGHLHQALYELVGVSARCSSRLLVTAEVDFGGAAVERVFQTVNISKSGFLLKARKVLEPGTVIACRLQLPDFGSPLRLVAEVARATDPDREGVRGVGLRFLDFEGEGQKLLTRFVKSRSDEAGDGS